MIGLHPEQPLLCQMEIFVVIVCVVLLACLLTQPECSKTISEIP